MLPREAVPVAIPVGELQESLGDYSEVAELGRLFEIDVGEVLGISSGEVCAKYF